MYYRDEVVLVVIYYYIKTILILPKLVVKEKCLYVNSSSKQAWAV